MSKKTWGLVFIVVLLAGVAGAWWAHTMAPHRHQWLATPDEAGGVVYTCSMHPQVRQDQPGNCPICGMQLVKRDAAPTAIVLRPRLRPPRRCSRRSRASSRLVT